MGIQVRYDDGSNTQVIREIVEGIAGEAGAAGEQGEQGEPGADLVTKPPVYLTSAPTFNTLSPVQGSCFRVKMTQDAELKFSAFPDGAKFSVTLEQTGAGGWDVTWPLNVKWANGGAAPTLTPDAGQRDTFGFERYKAGVNDFYAGFVIGRDI